MKNHHIIIGWNELSRKLIKVIREKKAGEDVLLIDASLDSPPEHESNLMFIKGDIIENEIITKANMKYAKTVVVTSDPTKGETEADLYSILITISVKVANPNIKVFTEIITKKQVENAKRAGATTVIRSDEFIGSLFFHEIFGGKLKTSSLIKTIAEKYKTLSVPNHLEGSTFKEYHTNFLRKGNLLIGIVCNGNMSINPPSSTIINDGDLLIAI